MSTCSSTGDCFKASLQFKLDKATGKVSQNATKAEWQATSSTRSSPTLPAHAIYLGSTLDTAG